jgi:hypothetical protein
MKTRSFLLAALSALTALAATAVAPVAHAKPLRVHGAATFTAPARDTATAPPQRWRCAGPADATPFARVELFFGLAKPGGVVSEAEFKAFVDSAVTPRFPEGLTVLDGAGQFRDAGGTIVVEGSKLLILLVPARDGTADAKIEQIRSDYKQAFQQQSVLRADDASCVSF